MKHEIKKVSKILDELVTFFFLNHAEELDISVQRTADAYVLKLHTNSIECSSERIDRIHSYLKAQRQTEIESYYWQLAGETEDSAELSLVGMMIDEATVEFHDKELTLYLKRKI